MRIGMIGLGKMGLPMSLRLLRAGHGVAGLDRDAGKARVFSGEGGEPVADAAELAERLPSPRAIWLMLPAGAPVDEQLSMLSGVLSEEDLVIDGGNSRYSDAERRAAALARRGIRYMDVGVSGGVRGGEEGYCLMAGGHEEDFRRIEPVLRALACPGGYLHCGPLGAGHFTKMVHNGIEYGLMQSYAEGFELLEASPFRQDNAALARLWGRGSVVRSWLLELAGEAFAEDPDLARASPRVEDSGEGRWMIQEAAERGVALPAISAALQARFLSRGAGLGPRLLSALRGRFGGHQAARAGR